MWQIRRPKETALFLAASLTRIRLCGFTAICLMCLAIPSAFASVTAGNPCNSQLPNIFGGTGASASANCTTNITFNGAARTYRLHIPLNYVPGNALVFVLHGTSGTGSGIENVTLMSNESDAKGFVVVYPNGAKNLSNVATWNLYYDDSTFGGTSSAPDDVGFFR